MFKRTQIAFFITATLLMQGCASIISDTQYPVAIRSVPDNAEFVVTDRKGNPVHSGRTPATVTLKSSAGYFQGETYRIKLKKEGFQEKEMVLDSSVNPWYAAGNLVFGGLIGWIIVDPITGAMWKLPENVESSLMPLSTTSQLPKTDGKVLLLTDVPAEYRPFLQPIQ